MTKKRVFIIHGWGANSERLRLQWLKKELNKRGFEVFIPAMPNTDEPKIEEWVNFLSTNNFVAIFSDNDPYVPIKDKDIFKEKLNAEIIIEHNKGHFTDEDGVKELPSALKSLLKMAGKNGDPNLV